MRTLLQNLFRWANRHAGKLLLVGLVGVAWRNWRRWQQDKRLLVQRKVPPALPPLEKWPALPLVSLLVAAWNEAEHIEGHIESFLALNYPNKELILCAGGADGTYQLAKAWAGRQVTVLEQQAGEGKYRALQRSLPLAKGQIIHLTDADCLLNSESVEQLIYPIVSGNESVTTAQCRPFSTQLNHLFVHYQWASQRYSEVMNSNQYIDCLAGSNSALLRPVLEEGWQTKGEVPIAEDLHLGLRLTKAGTRIRQVQGSYVETEYNDSFWPYIRQQNRWLRGMLLFGYQFEHKEHFRHAFLTSLIGQSLLAIPLTSLLLGKLGLVGWIIAWSAVAIARLRYISVLNQVEGINSPLLSPALLKLMIADFIAWARTLFDLGRAEWRERW